MGIFRKVFESKEARAKRIAMERGQVVDTVENAIHRALDYSDSLSVFAAVKRLNEYLKEEPNDAPIRFLMLFLFSISRRIEDHEGLTRLDLTLQDPVVGAMVQAATPVVAALQLIRKYPNCAEMAFTLAGGEKDRLRSPLVVRKGYRSEVEELMRIYDTFWETFVSPSLVCPLDSYLIRKHLTQKGYWDLGESKW